MKTKILKRTRKNNLTRKLRIKKKEKYKKVLTKLVKKNSKII